MEGVGEPKLSSLAGHSSVVPWANKRFISVVERFLTNEGVESSQILTRLRAQFDQTPDTQVFYWAKRFRSGCDGSKTQSSTRSSVNDDNTVKEIALESVYRVPSKKQRS